MRARTKTGHPDGGLDPDAADAGPDGMTRDAGPRDAGPRDASEADASTAQPLPPGVRPYSGELTGDTLGRLARRPTFHWPASAGATRYELDVDDTCVTPGFAECAFESPEIHETALAAPIYTPATALPANDEPPVGRRYYWRHRACTESSCDAWSPVIYVDVDRRFNDYNGDGYADLLLDAGSEIVDAEGVRRGHFRTYLGGPDFDGLPDENITLDIGKDGDYYHMFRGNYDIGDFDADGFADFAVIDRPSPTWDPAEIAHVLYGGASWTRRTTTMVGSPRNQGSWFEGLVEGNVDLNADGYADLVREFSTVGACIFAGWWSYGGHRCAMTPAGDINGDGFADLVASDNVDLTVTPLFGPISGEDNVSLIAGGPTSDGTTARSLFGVVPGWRHGAIRGGSDLNGDQFMDLAFELENGAVEVRLGGSAFYGDVALGLPDQSLAGFGDFNGDGFPDLLTCSSGGGGNLYFGGASLRETPDLVLPVCSSFVGDLNRDGYTDIYGGERQVFFGAAEPDALPDVTLE
ncbi:MAG: VCBS repeat-containing protein [Myxococcales bacterium]